MQTFSNEWVTEGMAKTLAHQFQVKFGQLSAEAEERIANATPARIKAWAGAVLTANSPAEVFAARKTARGGR